MGTVFFVTLFVAREAIFRLYTNQSAVIDQLRLVWPCILVYAFFDCIQYAG